MRAEIAPRSAPQPRIERAGSSAGPLKAAPQEALNAPLFHSVIERLQTADGRVVVLDLGTARTETVGLFGQFRCRIDIADLADGVDALNEELDPKALRIKTEALLPPKRREPTDIVLCWDLLNYLRRPALTMVMEAIAARGRRGMLAHCLVFYAAPQMPVQPGCFVPIDESRLLNVAPPQATRSAPRYTPEDLSQCLPGYVVERARLLRNGMQEYLFRL